MTKPPTKANSDLRTQILENLLHRVRDDRFPSPTMLDMIEAVLHPEDVNEYTALLFDKVRDVRYPSMDLMRRLYSFL